MKEGGEGRVRYLEDRKNEMARKGNGEKKEKIKYKFSHANKSEDILKFLLIPLEFLLIDFCSQGLAPRGCQCNHSQVKMFNCFITTALGRFF